MRYSIDEQYMFRCITLAKLGQYHASPNPMVGSVLVYKDTIIGEGWHHKAGQAHAEVNCIRSVKPEHQHLIAESTLYVSLEPCAHYGKTPPCAELIIKHKIPKVVIGCIDSFSKVSGKGIEMLQNNGIEVITRILEAECLQLNKHFFTFHNKKRPYITLKWAETADGFIAPIDGHKVMLSNYYAVQKVHQLRTTEQAFLIGFNTAFRDNPYLSNRHWPVDKQPIRIILDPNHNLPEDLHIFNGFQQTIILTKAYEHSSGNNTWITLGDTFSPSIIIQKIYDLGIASVVIEGGNRTLQNFIHAKLWDEAIIFKTTFGISNGTTAPILRFNSYKQQQIDDNTLLHIYALP